jgi:hypothetical protein
MTKTLVLTVRVIFSNIITGGPMQNPYTQPVYPYFGYANNYNPRASSGSKADEYKGRNYKDFFDLGDKAPDFTLDAVVKGQRANVSLSDYAGKWVVLFFYGSNFTFV